MRVTDRRLGWLFVAAGAIVVLGVQVAQPVGVPLYDGVVIQEPYRYLHPTGDQAGSPTSYSGETAVSTDLSPIFSAYTGEQPPQAQLISTRGGFTLTPGATKVFVSITAVEPPPAPTGGTIAGNVYRFSVTDQAGTALQVRACQACLTLRMRGPAEIGEAVLKRYADGAWHDVETIHEGIGGTYVTNVLALGDYAVIEKIEEEPGLSPIVFIGGGAVIVLLAIGAFLLFRVRQAPAAPTPAPRARIPSKRKGRR